MFEKSKNYKDEVENILKDRILKNNDSDNLKIIANLLLKILKKLDK